MYRMKIIMCGLFHFRVEHICDRTVPFAKANSNFSPLLLLKFSSIIIERCRSQVQVKA